ncbi:DUF484 family protein [Candidatus Puniceispirillum sp.]|nr:DUF484 family protein [Candidatus Puniceispirillum sp.]
MVDDYLTKNITTTDVAAFLANNPGAINNMLTTHPELLALCLAAAANHSQENKHIDSKVIDLIPAIAAKARHDARKINQTHQSLLHVAAENMLSWTRLHHATLALLASTDLSNMCKVILEEFPVIFDLNQCQLIIKNNSTMMDITNTGLAIHPAAQIEASSNGQDLFLGLPNAAAQTLLVKPAQSIAIIRLPDRLPEPVSQSVLILGGKTANSFHPDLGSDLLVLLAEMVGVTLAARLELEDELK